MSSFKIISQPGPERSYRVWTTYGRSVTIKAPDADVALYRAKRRGVAVSGRVELSS